MEVSALFKIPAQWCCTTELLISTGKHSVHNIYVQWSFMIVHTWVESAGISLVMPFLCMKHGICADRCDADVCVLITDTPWWWNAV